MIAVVGSLNMDLIVETPHLPAPGETVAGTDFRQYPGGKGANQACAIARLGVPVSMIGSIGADSFGQAIRENLVAFGVDPIGVRIQSDIASGLAFILVDRDGQNQIVVSPGANARTTPEDIMAQSSVLKSSRAVIAQLEVPIPAIQAAFAIARAAGVMTILNPAPALSVPDELFELSDWIIPNELEAAPISRKSFNHPDDASVVARAIRERFPKSRVLITLGAAGAWLETNETTQRIPSRPGPVVDTVGAGDAFIGAFVTRLTEGAEPLTAAHFATAAASLAIGRPGAQNGLPIRSEVDKHLGESAAVN